MTRTSVPLLRLTAAAAVGTLALTLSGCLYAQIPVDVAAPTPTPTKGATEDPSEGTDGLPTSMTFADGTAIPSSAYIQWGDGLLTDDGWTIVKPDDGAGGWTYGTVDGTCTAQFWQGLIPDVPTVAGDDSASSDAMLAVILGEASAATITPVATTAAFSYQIGGNAAVENRQLVGTAGEREWIMAARAFTATGVGLYVIVDCTGGDVDAVMAEVVDANAVIIM